MLGCAALVVVGDVRPPSVRATSFVAETGDTTVVPPAARARALWLRAGALNADSFRPAAQLRLLRAAIAIDPQFVPAHLTYIDLMRQLGRTIGLRREYRRESAAGRSGLFRCLRLDADLPANLDGPAVLMQVRAIARRTGSNPCTRYLEARFASVGQSTASPSERAHLLGAYFDHDHPDGFSLRLTYARTLLALGDTTHGLEVLDSGLVRCVDAICRVRGTMDRARYLWAIGRRQESRGLEQAVRQAVGRDGRPGLRVQLLSGLAALAGDRGDRSAQIDEYRARATVDHAIGNWPNELNALRDIALALIDQGDAARAFPVLDSAVSLATRRGGPAQVMDALLLRGRAYAKLGRGKAALAELTRGLAIGRRVHEPYLQADLAHNMIHAYEAMDELDSAELAGERALRLARTIPGTGLRLIVPYDLGVVRWHLGRHASARTAFDEMVSVIDAERRNYYWAGTYYERIGDLPRALHYYRRGAVRGAGDRVSDFAGLARIYDALDQSDSAEAMARRHDRLLEGNASPWTLPLVPELLLHHGHVTRAIAAAKAWVDRRTAGGSAESMARARLLLAQVFLGAKKPTQAAHEAKLAEDLAGHVALTDVAIAARRIRGTATLLNGDSDHGIALLRQAAADAAGRADFDVKLDAQLALGRALAREPHVPVDSALAVLDLAARTVETASDSFPHDLDRAMYRARWIEPFDEAIALLLRTPAARRSRTLDELLSWSARRKAAALRIGTGKGSGPRDLVRDLGPREIADVRATLEPGDLLLDYLDVDSTLAVLAVSHDTARLIRLRMTPRALNVQIRQLVSPFANVHMGRIDLARVHFDVHTAHALYQALIAPLGSALGKAKRLIVVPDGPLHRLPFDALVQSVSDKTVRYLLDDFEVVYLPSSRMVRLLSAEVPDSKLARAPVLAVGFDSPGAVREVNAVTSAWPRGRVHVLTGEEATETRVRAAIAPGEILDLATHARVDVHDPLGSYIRLRADTLNDGFLQMTEIPSAAHGISLVVLSACETYGGRLLEGEGPLALSRAFLTAGARTVVATEWPVGSAAATLVGDVHRRLAHGEPPAAALRHAQLDVRQDARTRSPFFWAGFLVIGRG